MRKFAQLVLSLFAIVLSSTVMADAAAELQLVINELKKAQQANDVGKVNQIAANLKESAAKLSEAAASASGDAATSMQFAAQNLQAAANAASLGDVAGAIATLEVAQPAIAAGITAAGATGAAVSGTLIAGIAAATGLAGAAVAAGLNVIGRDTGDDTPSSHHGTTSHHSTTTHR